MRRWICLLWICLPFRQVHIFRTYSYSRLLKILQLHYTQVLCQYRLCIADHTYITYLML
jgi:hypothetical protein